MPLDTKVRWKDRLILLFLLPLVSCSGPKCDKTPLGQEAAQTRGDYGFYVTMAGQPRLYRPGQVYTVTLAGIREDVKVKFIDFMIVAESNLPSTEVSGLGTFQLMPGDAMSKFSHKCSHAVMATSALSKEEVEVLWTAPDQHSGCIWLKAMVVERNDFWFMDDGALKYEICEDTSPMATPPVVEPCTACDEAKYEVIFEGLWSRHTHPKDFPRDEWQTQFSHMIGASHSIDYDLWKYGEVSSAALSMLAEDGETKKLEIDMKRYSKDIRSVIKARGLQQRSNVVGRTFAVFRMDATKHLLSLVSKIIPSPDWIVGVSMENLCLANGSWVDSRVVDLYPWDTGTKSGLGYHDAGEQTQPREPIHRITSCNPDNDLSPFFDPTCAPVKPVARLHILKQREYKKQCAGRGPALGLNTSWGSPNAPGLNERGEVYSGNGIGQHLPEETEDNDPTYDYSYEGNTYRDQSSNSYNTGYSSSSSFNRDNSLCEVTDWTSWTRCSQTCDVGSQSRSRSYANPTGAQIGNCNTERLEKQVCRGLPACPAREYGGNYDPFFSTDELSGYTSQWSNRGLSSHSLTETVEEEVEEEPRSYLYEGQPSSEVGSPSSYIYHSQDQLDPYSDPYNQYSGYAKQKGYPPKTNHPSSSRYNPYKEMGYYGYIYGGPPTGGYRQSTFQTVNDQEEVESEPSCEVTNWGDWSHCSTDCGTGTRTRTRHYTEQESSSCSAELYETAQCEERSGCSRRVQESTSSSRPPPRRKMTPPPTSSLPSVPQTTGRTLPRPRKQVGRRKLFRASDPQCEVAHWTLWSPCSVTCDKGYKIRTRVYKMPFVPNRICDNIRLTQKQDCRQAACWNSDYYDAHDDSGDRDMVEYEEEEVTLVMVEQPRQSFCSLEPSPGICKTTSMERWFYNATERVCGRFRYTGCGGNRNNFNTESECLTACQRQTGPDPRFRGLQSQSLVREDYLQDQALLPVDCLMTDWSDWSACSASCSRGWQTMSRSVVTGPRNGGRQCPRKMNKRKRCREVPCPASPQSWYQSNWRMLSERTDI